MEFMNRSGQPRPTNNSAASAPVQPKQAVPVAADNGFAAKAGAATHGSLFRWGFLALLFSGTALFVAMLFFMVFGAPVNHEAKGVDKSAYQAVFINVNGTNGGQVYFGHVKELSPQFIRLTNVFYIQNQQSQDQSAGAYNLVKLGCELHGPTDEMFINRSQVFFWENLKSDSQVAQKAAEFYKQNPNGQKCSTTTNSTQQSSGTGTTTPATGTSTTNTPATTPSTGTGTTTPTATPPAATTKKQ